jgi:hypothetical protein
MLGVDQHGDDTHLVGDPQAAVQGIDEQVLAESLALHATVDRQASEPGNRDGIVGEVLCGLRRQVGLVDASDSERVVAENTVGLLVNDRDEGSNDAGFLVLAGVTERYSLSAGSPQSKRLRSCSRPSGSMRQASPEPGRGSSAGTAHPAFTVAASGGLQTRPQLVSLVEGGEESVPIAG